MRSLSIKLITAFVVIGLVSILSIVLLARWNTRNEFDRFIVDRRGQDLLSSVQEYYVIHGSWQGVDGTLVQISSSAPPGDPAPRPPFTIADRNGQAVLEGAGYQPGDPIKRQELSQGIAIDVNGAQVGTLIMGRAPLPNTPREAEFITRINRLFWYSAIGASLLALLLGVIISRTLTGPIRELTQAAHAISEGDLTQQVSVRSRDEMGELAKAFNRMSSELRRSVNLRRQMTADIAHELRTPLSLILGHAEAVHDGVLPPSNENFEIIREEAGRLEHLIDELRTLSLADAGELSIQTQPVQPDRLLQEVASLYSYQSQKKEVSLAVQVNGPLPEVQLDTGRMTQVLTNILDNALRHTPSGGSITLAARPVEAGVELSVQDTGPGLEAEDLERIFDRLYRADASRHRGDGGSGLGLAIAKSIVQAHGGQIRAEGGPGAGLKISITLPAA
jgi:signal transduction histidine kinase